MLFRSGIFAPKLAIDIKNKDKQISNKNKDNWIIKEIDGREINESTYIVPKWDEMSISQQFSLVQYNNNSYSSRITKISSDNIVKNIGSSILDGYDTYTGTTYSKSGELYSIKDISEKCAIAVKFEDDIDYYVYVNSDYRPTTLKEFMNDLNLKENTSFGTIYYSYWDKNSSGDMEHKDVEFYNVDNEIIWKMLFDNVDLENIYSDTDSGNYMSERWTTTIDISVDIPLLGYKNISVELTDKGYLLTNILDTGKGFYIGENKVQEFFNYVKENYDGYQIVYIDENDDNALKEENIETNNEIVMVENTSKGYTYTNISTENKTKESRVMNVSMGNKVDSN